MTDSKILKIANYTEEWEYRANNYCINCGSTGIWVTSGSDTSYDGICINCEAHFAFDEPSVYVSERLNQLKTK